MILYHGSNTEINKVQLEKCRPSKDFGQGFYLTTIKEQAIKMAKRVAFMYGGKPCITIFTFNENALSAKKLNIRIFKNPTEEWAKFVIANRNSFKMEIQEDNNVNNQFDIVIGPIANDDLALLFRQFVDGLITVESLVKEMKFKKLTNQYSFHTVKSLEYLQKFGVEYV